MGGVAEGSDKLAAGRLLAYSALLVPINILHAPALASLPGLYAKYAGIDLTAMGVILTLSRLFDVVIDPLIGFASDRTRSPWGQRKPWIAEAAKICATRESGYSAIGATSCCSCSGDCCA